MRGVAIAVLAGAMVLALAAPVSAMPYVAFVATGTAVDDELDVTLDVQVRWQLGNGFTVSVFEPVAGLPVPILRTPGELLMTNWLFFELERCGADPLASSADFRGYDRQTEGALLWFEGPLVWCWNDISMVGEMNGELLGRYDLRLTEFAYD